MRASILTGSSKFSTVDATLRELANTLEDQKNYVIVSSTNAYVRQGTAKKITCATQANMADTDYITITHKGTAVTYEFDKAGDGVTAGRVQVNISTDTTAATVAARLKTAIEANQTGLRVVDPADGTLTIDAVDTRDLTIIENVAHASFTITAGIMQASAAAGSMILPAGVPFFVEGALGAQLSVLQVSAGGAVTIMSARII